MDTGDLFVLKPPLRLLSGGLKEDKDKIMIIWQVIAIDSTYSEDIELPDEICIPRLMLTKSVSDFLGGDKNTSKTFLIGIKKK